MLFSAGRRGRSPGAGQVPNRHHPSSHGAEDGEGQQHDSPVMRKVGENRAEMEERRRLTRIFHPFRREVAEVLSWQGM